MLGFVTQPNLRVSDRTGLFLIAIRCLDNHNFVYCCNRFNVSWAVAIECLAEDWLGLKNMLDNIRPPARILRPHPSPLPKKREQEVLAPFSLGRRVGEGLPHFVRGAIQVHAGGLFFNFRFWGLWH